MKIWLFLVLILALGLRLINLSQSFWLDEASQAQLSSLSLPQIWSNRSGDFQPPLFYFLAHYWLQLGRSETWLRLLPISFGILNVAVIYYLARAINPKLGLIAAFLLATNPFHVYYSQEFRMYSLLALLGTLSILAFYKKHWSLFLINAIMLYTHYAAVFLILSQLAYSLIFDRKLLKFSLVNCALSIAFYAPWLPQFQRQLQSGANIDTYLPGWRNILTLSPLRSLPLILFKFVAGRIDLIPRYIYAVYMAFILLVTTVGILLARGKRRLLYTWLFAPIIGSIILSFFIPQTQPFRLIFTLPALIILLAEAVMRFPKIFFTLLIYIAIVGNYTYFTRPRLQREQWRQALEFIRTRPATMMVKFPGPFTPMTWYAPDLPVVTASSFRADLSDFYLFQYLTGLTDPQYKIDAQIQANGYVLQKRYNFEGVGFIDYYHK